MFLKAATGKLNHEAPDGNRTRDLLFSGQLLYPLSYGGTES